MASAPAAKRPSLAKPRAAEAAVISKGAEAPGARSRVQVSVYLDDATLARIEKARQATGGYVTLDRNQYLRAAILDKLDRDGF